MKRHLIALTVAATTALSAPAMAGGTISLSINAKNADEARAIRHGLIFYNVMNDIKSNGHITQKGVNNLAALGQSGHGNIGVIHQDGNGHNASLSQNGNHNSCGIFQFGNGANGHVQQNGNGQGCLVLQAGF